MVNNETHDKFSAVCYTRRGRPDEAAFEISALDPCRLLAVCDSSDRESTKDTILNICRHGLTGWFNLREKTGEEIRIESEEVLLAGGIGPVLVVRDESLLRLEWEWRDELAAHILFLTVKRLKRHPLPPEFDNGAKEMIYRVVDVLERIFNDFWPIPICKN